MVSAEAHEHHPGYTAGDCPLRISVSGVARTDGGRGGYACDHTGGHCLPSGKCATWRNALKENAND